MTKEHSTPKAVGAKQTHGKDRDERLKAALKANLARRKTQAKLKLSAQNPTLSSQSRETKKRD